MEAPKQQAKRVFQVLAVAYFDGRYEGSLSVERISRLTSMSTPAVQAALRTLQQENLITGAQEAPNGEFWHAALCGRGLESARQLLEAKGTIRARPLDVGEEQIIPFSFEIPSAVAWAIRRQFGMPAEGSYIRGRIKCTAEGPEPRLKWLPEILEAEVDGRAVEIKAEFKHGGSECKRAREEFLGVAASNLAFAFAEQV